MMKRLLYSLILGILFAVGSINAQIEFTYSMETTNTGGTVDVDVTVTGFTNISTCQFSTNWNPEILTFNSIASTNPGLSDLNGDSFGTPEGSEVVDEGELTLSYNNPNLNGTLPDGSVIFTMRFNVIGDECDETAITMTGTPTSIEATDEVFNLVDVTSVPGSVMINGADCNGGGDNLTITAEERNVFVGDNICVPLSVTNFIGVQAGSGTILWDPAVISYTGITNIGITGVNGSLNESNVTNGELKFVWSNPSPSTPLDLSDGEAIFDICFDAVGDLGDMSAITLSEEGNLGFEWFDDNDEVIPQSLQNGKVTIVENTGPPFTLTVSDEIVNQGTTNVCVDVTTENFINILSTQYVITWGAGLLSNPTPANFNLQGLSINNFNVGTESVTVSWSEAASPVTIDDGTVIFSICFDVPANADCDETVAVSIVSDAITTIEIVDGNTDVIENTSFVEGSVTVGCQPDCEVLQEIGACAGQSTGSILVNVETNGCTYSWANGSGVEVSTDRNLTGAMPGTYFLTVTCGGEEICTLEGTIPTLPGPTLDETITNAACGVLGSISVEVSGGSGNYNFNWNPTQPNSGMISDLEAGGYDLTVTDNDSGCSTTASYTVMDVVEDMSITINSVNDETCLENNGSISITVSGGCQPYTYTWSDASIGNTPNALNLNAGAYSVTVSDDSNPANMVSESFMVGGFTPITQDDVTIVGTPAGMNIGSIDIDVSGGTAPYSYAWTGPTSGLPDSDIITNLNAGMYSVVVTDSEGCDATFGPFEVIEIEDTEGLAELTDVGATNNEFGFALACNGDADGAISGVVSGGDLPVTLNLSGPSSETITLSAFSSFTFSNLGAGTYSIEAVNNSGDTTISNIEVTEPDALTTDVEFGCDNNIGDGFIDLNTSGGTGMLSFTWNDPALTEDSADDLSAGDYTVVIEDESGCEIMESITIEFCDGPTPGCYEVRDVITPNGDNVNDRFVITCVQDFPANLEIYDRWGELVYEQASYDGRWEGTDSSGEQLIEGGYMYILRIDFGQGRREIMRGTVTILRN